MIYYADGSSFTSEDGPPEAAPRVGVQVVVTYSPKVGKLPWHNVDYFCWQGDTWVSHGFDGLLKYLEEPGKEKIVLRSWSVPPDAFMDIYEKAISDPRMPWKSQERNPDDPLHQYPPSM